MDDMERETRTWELKQVACAQSLLLVSRSRLVPGAQFVVPHSQEAPMVSDVASPSQAEAIRDRAVVRTGEGPAFSFPAREVRGSVLALLLT